MQRRILLALTLLSVSSYSWPENISPPEELLAAGEYQQALRLIEQQLEGQPDAPKISFLQAVILEKIGQTEAAAAIYQRLIQDYPDLPEPYNNLAVLYARQGKLQNAEQTLQEAIKTHPSYATAHNNLSDIYKTLASIAYNKALNLSNGQARPEQATLQTIESLYSFQPAASATPELNEPNTVQVTSTNTPSAQEPPSSQPLPTESPSAETTEQKIDSIPQKTVDINTVEKSVHAWAQAWSHQDINAYLTSYSTAFKPVDGLGRAEWEAQRKDRLQAPTFIRIEIFRPAITVLNNELVSVIFKQRYQSDRFKETTDKLLLLTYENEQWRILQETEIK